MNIDYTAISALAAVIAAVAAVIAVWLEGRRSRFSHGVDLLLKLDESFQNPEMKQRRQALARRLLQNDKIVPLIERNNYAEDILDFFEMVGLLLRRGALDRQLVYATFFYWVEFYTTLLRRYIEIARSSSSTVWEDIDWMHTQLSLLSQRSQDSSEKSDETLVRFLQLESDLHDVNA